VAGPQRPISPNPSSVHEHWEKVYRTRPSTEVSWYRPHLERSLAFIETAAPDRDSCILDVGGGASTLMDDLLVRGYRRLSVLDVSQAALDTARGRLGEAAQDVAWLQGDVRTVALEAQSTAVWHDRAVFHFLTDEADRAAYVRQVLRTLKPDGHLIVATFAPDGPTRCSGLPVVRYDAPGLQQVFGGTFRLKAHATEAHATPGGNVQPFVYCHFERTDS
jgi:SAM-dependent methyltransferase